MSHAIPMLRLTPQAAGTLQQQHDKATKELRALTHYSKELDRQLKALIGYDALRQLHKATENALLLADLPAPLPRHLYPTKSCAGQRSLMQR